METAMQELIEHFTFHAGNYSCREEILAKANQLLVKEKQQIKDAYTFGEGNAYESEEKSNNWAEQYYNETFSY
jgi:hypothetical protein